MTQSFWIDLSKHTSGLMTAQKAEGLLNRRQCFTLANRSLSQLTHAMTRIDQHMLRNPIECEFTRIIRGVYQTIYRPVDATISVMYQAEYDGGQKCWTQAFQITNVDDIHPTLVIRLMHQSDTANEATITPLLTFCSADDVRNSLDNHLMPGAPMIDDRYRETLRNVIEQVLAISSEVAQFPVRYELGVVQNQDGLPMLLFRAVVGNSGPVLNVFTLPPDLLAIQEYELRTQAEELGSMSRLSRENMH